jgi:Uroporphyrinogen decarboxylase (URO-D)
VTTEVTDKWADMSAAERRQARIEEWRSAPGVEFSDAQARETYTDGVNRLVDTIECRVPDRVPIMVSCTFMPFDLYGVSPHSAMYDVQALVSTEKQFLLDYRPDYYFTPALIGAGQVLEMLDVQQYAWPGHGVPETSGYQYREAEYMPPEDYDALIDDPSDFWIRRFLPRAMHALEPLSRIPAFTDLWEIGPQLTAQLIPFGAPDVQDALKALLDAGREAFTWGEQIGAFEAEVQGLGFVSCAGGLSKAPFDLLADTVRGTRATMIDMRRRPDKLLAAVERFTPLAIKQGIAGATAMHNPIVFMPLHKGADGFMSDEQFRTMYWPSLKAVVDGLVADGCIPFLFCEGGYDTRLEYLTELPPESTLCIFDRTDMRRAKEMLGGRVCIGGNVPSGMILTGSAEDVRAYCKELIDDVAPGGGYIMSFGTAMDEGKPDTVHAMVDFTREYGVYR